MRRKPRQKKKSSDSRKEAKGLAQLVKLVNPRLVNWQIAKNAKLVKFAKFANCNC